MTNAEKYKEVFGLEVDPGMCPTRSCSECPCARMDHSTSDTECSSVGASYEWWNKEYNDNYRAK